MNSVKLILLFFEKLKITHNATKKWPNLGELSLYQEAGQHREVGQMQEMQFRNARYSWKDEKSPQALHVVSVDERDDDLLDQGDESDDNFEGAPEPMQGPSTSTNARAAAAGFDDSD